MIENMRVTIITVNQFIGLGKYSQTENTIKNIIALNIYFPKSFTLSPP